MFSQVPEKTAHSRYWSELSDVSNHLRLQWENQFLNLTLRLSAFEVQNRKESLRSLLRLVLLEWDKLIMLFGKPYLFIFTDITGVVLEMKSIESIMIKLEECNIGQGSSFALENMGINGISMAMAMKKPVLVKGSEHHLELFSHWCCVCQPIILNGNIQGYLDISMHKDEDFTWAFVLLGKLVMDIEQMYLSDDPVKKQQTTMENLSLHGLSVREKEIAWRWLNNESTMLISKELYISEGTVRNHIKKVYSKTGVSEKGRFLRKFV